MKYISLIFFVVVCFWKVLTLQVAESFELKPKYIDKVASSGEAYLYVNSFEEVDELNYMVYYADFHNIPQETKSFFKKFAESIGDDVGAAVVNVNNMYQYSDVSCCPFYHLSGKPMIFFEDKSGSKKSCFYYTVNNPEDFYRILLLIYKKKDNHLELGMKAMINSLKTQYGRVKPEAEFIANLLNVLVKGRGSK
ncbi:MAG: hypothetical protein ACNI3A_18095 [Desulfovibrio sp.]|uniref:hypothetical protein n=1 Tax=Desulfovibrio sp. 7SRBS1 TaxID=3378064 RepID=UPI003B3CD628